jgi:hypothetical protein
VTKTAVATEIHQALQGRLCLSTKVTLYFLSSLDELSDLVYLLLGERISTHIVRDACLSQDLLRLGEANSVNVREAPNDSLVSRKIYSCNTWHVYKLLLLTLGVAYA